MEVLEVTVEQVNLIEVDVSDGQSEIDVEVNALPEVEVQAFDYPAEIDVLTRRVIATEASATEAAASAAQSEQDALLSAQSAASSSSNAAASAQSAQTAAQTAGNAVTAMNNHIQSTEAHGKENLPGLKITDSPEFADVNATGLSLQASYSEAIWQYLLSMFGTVPKSTKSHIIKLWDRAKNSNDRLMVLETFNNEYEKQLTLEGDYVNSAIGGGSLSAFPLTANRVMLIPYIPKISFNCKELQFEITTGVLSSFSRMCVFGSKSKRPYSLIFKGNSFDSSITGIKSDYTIDFNFQKNTLYWIGLQSNDAPYVRAFSSYVFPKVKSNISPTNNIFNYIYFTIPYSSGLPGTLDGVTLSYAYNNLPHLNYKVNTLL